MKDLFFTLREGNPRSIEVLEALKKKGQETLILEHEGQDLPKDRNFIALLDVRVSKHVVCDPSLKEGPSSEKKHWSARAQYRIGIGTDSQPERDSRHILPIAQKPPKKRVPRYCSLQPPQPPVDRHPELIPYKGQTVPSKK